MLTTSPPVGRPESSSAPAAKRPAPARKPRVGGFLLDDSDSDSDADSAAASRPNACKRPRLHSPDGRKATAPTAPTDGGDVEPVPVPVPVRPSFDVMAALASLSEGRPHGSHTIRTCSGKSVCVRERTGRTAPASYEQLVAARSRTKEGRARRSYYGVAVHELIDLAKAELTTEERSVAAVTANAAVVADRPLLRSVEAPSSAETKGRKQKSMLWTERYRARKFMDLCGDDLTNRQVLRWLKGWDPLVFPRAARSKPIRRAGATTKGRVGKGGEEGEEEEEKVHRKVLLLTGPPGLGKTTLAHVCARQAGYEVLEINASDDRGRDVVRNRIRTSLGTDNVKTVQHGRAGPGQAGKIARPVCVVVDEVDGVVSGSGASGEGGFIKTLVDLIALGEKNRSGHPRQATQSGQRRNRKGDDFKQMRPLILICNDVYHPSLRPLRQSGMAEVIHVGKPTVEAVVARLAAVFEKEGIPCEKDAARRICEAAWGIVSGIDARKGAENTAEGDLRGIMVVGEWVAGRFRSSFPAVPCPRLSRQWVEEHVVHSLGHGGGGARGVGRGNTRDIVRRVFLEGAGFPKGKVAVSNSSIPLSEQPRAQLGITEQQKKYAMERLRHMVETSGEVDRIVTDLLSEYPNHDFNDDSFLTKPDQAYEWMHFHDCCTFKMFGSQDWELSPYLSQSVLACHDLFASPVRHSQLTYQKGGGDEEETTPLPFSGPRAGYVAHEATKENRAILQALQARLAPTLLRSFRSAEDISTEFLPYLVRMASPDVRPVVIGGGSGGGDQPGRASVRRESEKRMVRRAAETLLDVGVELQRGKLETDSVYSRGPTWVYRMEPDLDALSTFETSSAVVHGTGNAPTRYAVRQVVDQEVQRTRALREEAARRARYQAGGGRPRAAGHEEQDYVRDDKKSGKIRSGPAPPPVPLPVPDKTRRDFFGRVIEPELARPSSLDSAGDGGDGGGDGAGVRPARSMAWVTFHEGLNNAVRKPISLDEFLAGL